MLILTAIVGQILLLGQLLFPQGTMGLAFNDL